MEIKEYKNAVNDNLSLVKKLWIKGGYSIVAASALLPFLVQYIKNPAQALGAVAGILGSIGGNLIANMTQGIYDTAKSSKDSYDLEKLAAIISRQVKIDENMSISIAKLVNESGAINVIAQGLRDLPKQWEVFSNALLEQIDELKGTTIIIENLQVQDSYIADKPELKELRELLGDYARLYTEDTDHLRLGTIDPKFEVESTIKLSQVYISPTIRVVNWHTNYFEGNPSTMVSETLNNLDILSGGVAILGGPGSGKSAFVDRLTNSICNSILSSASSNSFDVWNVGNIEGWSGSLALPIRISLQEFAASGLTSSIERGNAGLLWKYICNMLENKALSRFCIYLEKILSGEQVIGSKGENAKLHAILLLDGLDEVPRSQRRIVEQTIHEFSHRFNKSLVVVTCRTYSWKNRQGDDETDDPLNDFTVYEMVPFSQEEISLFIRKWYNAVKVSVKQLTDDAIKYRIETLIEATKLDYLIPLAEKPLLLTLMATLHTSRGQLPHDRATLYADCVDLLLEVWQRDKDLHIGGKITVEGGLLEEFNITSEDAERKLRYIAYEAHVQGMNVSHDHISHKHDDVLIKADQLRAVFRPLVNNSWDRAEDLVNYIQRRAGLLEYVGEDTYRFPHRTFQEFLTACYMLDIPNSPNSLIDCVIQEPIWWSEVFSLAVGRQSRASYSQGVNILFDCYRLAEEKHLNDFRIYSTLLTAARDIELAKHQDESPWYLQILNSIIKAYLRTSKYNLRTNILLERGSIFSDVSYVLLPHVMPLIEDDEFGDSAAIYIGTYSDSSVTSRLIRLLSHNKQIIRMRAANALGRSRQSKVINVLAETVRRDHSIEVIREAVKAISNIGGYDAQIAIVEFINHEDDVVANTAAKFLADMAREDLRLLEVLQDFIESGHAKYNAACKIIEIFDEVRTKEAIECLIDLLLQDQDDYEDENLSSKAEEALISIGDDANSYLQRVYRETRDPRILNILHVICGGFSDDEYDVNDFDEFTPGIVSEEFEGDEEEKDVDEIEVDEDLGDDFDGYQVIDEDDMSSDDNSDEEIDMIDN